MAIELRNINPAVFNYNVGIGTASPTTLLQAYSTGVAAQVSIDGTGRYKYFECYASGTRKFRTGWDNTSGLSEVWSDASAPMLFGTADIERMRITAAGYVGIGTTGPLRSLHVQGASGAVSGTARATVIIDDTTAFATGVGGAITFRGKYNTAGDYVAGGYIQSQKTNATDGNDSFDLALGTRSNGSGAAEVMRLRSDGNVGIGTTSPGNKLSVNTPVAASEASVFITQAGSYSGKGLLVRRSAVAEVVAPVFAVEDSAGNNYFKVDADGSFSGQNGSSSNFFTIGQGGGGPYLKLNFNGGTKHYRLGTDDTQFYVYDEAAALRRFVISAATGNVGIGTTGPRQKLDVNGNITVGWAQGNRIGMDYLDGAEHRLGLSLFGNERATNVDALSADFSVITFRTGTVVAPAERMRITYVGNVGIGITSPTEKLHVEGNLKINGLLKFPDGSSYPSAAASASRAMACPIDGARGVYDNDVLWLWDGTYRTVNQAQYYIGRTESHATDGGSARVLDVLTTTGGGTFSDTGYYTTTWNSNYMIGVTTAASVGAPTTWVTATLPCDPSVHNVLHVKVISTDRWQSVGAYILNSSGALQSKLQTHSNASVNDSNGDISTVGPRNSAAKTTCCHEWVSIIIPKAHLTSHAYANINSPTGYSVKIALYNGHSSASALYIAGLGISRNPTGFVHINAIDIYWATNGGGTTGWYGNWNYDSMNQINAHTNYSDIRIPIAGTDRDILIGCVDHGTYHRGPGAIFWLNNYNQPSIPNATFYLSNLVTGTYGKMNIGYKYRGFSGFVVPKALVQAYVQTNLGQQYLSFYIYNQSSNFNMHLRAMYSEQVNRIGNSKSITGAAFNMKNSNYKAAEIVDISTYDGY